jgi:cation diffusion facilitator CzcD-associated flavoprotein CzcO
MTPPQHFRVAIVGAGLAGIAAALALKGEDVEDFVILERADDVGGVWRDNTYPGLACDVPSSSYSLAAAPNPDWSHTFGRGAEIWQYTRKVADEAGLRPHVRFGEELLEASWDDERHRWTITTTGWQITADVLVDCCGGLAEPSIPDIPGLQGFRGTMFHSARWDHDHDLRGKRVAVVGTGASAIQFVPEIQPGVKRMVVFQRTPAWVVRRSDRPVTAVERRLFRRFPAVQELQRRVQFAIRERLLYPVILRRPAWRVVMQALARVHLRQQVSDRRLRAKLTPDFEIGCKRILISNAWYRALDKPNVDVVAGGVREVREHSVIGADGSEHEVDTIIFGTGFEVASPPTIDRIRGRDGRSLGEHWHGAPRHYRAVSIAGFPNFFRLGGAGCGIGHASMIYQLESQASYVVEALRTMSARGVMSVEVTEAAQDAYLRWLAAELAGTVWMAGGCQSWYQDAEGQATTMWPGTVAAYRRLMSRFEPADHELRTRVYAVA